ncbi:hypothetical protein HPB50_013269 [Hyalomma asiaticum]|uniref:Uncharacterized protein n=1 Tax=Hyalomma asiaticum TaxID=266040 RepID=A0ACB7T7S9_HYAAI|nr:hypothetical protein HPB50_013269 [Hyalomma asiaticum]
MKISAAVIVSLVGLLIVSMPGFCETKPALALVPFVWAGNLAKDATQTLVAYKLSLATKALAMITGNRSFKATIAYDSHLERFEDAPAEDFDHEEAWSSLKSTAAVTSAPSPMHVDKEVKVEWLSGMSKPVIRFPALPKFIVPKFVVHNVAVPKVKVPQLPRIVVPKLVVPRIVMSEVAIPDVVQSKVDLLSNKINHKLNKLGSGSASLLSQGGPKYASGYIQGGFRVGHGTGRAADAKLGSEASPTPVPPVATEPSVTETEKNMTSNHSRPVRSIDESVMGRYFRFIQANDEGRCVALMVCSMAAHPQEFGVYGRKVVDFFNDVHPKGVSPVAAYKEASSVGRSGDSCRSRYSACQVDPKFLAQLGESHVHL